MEAPRSVPSTYIRRLTTPGEIVLPSRICKHGPHIVYTHAHKDVYTHIKIIIFKILKTNSSNGNGEGKKE